MICDKCGKEFKEWQWKQGATEHNYLSLICKPCWGWNREFIEISNLFEVKQ